LARALLREPSVLVLDETFGHLDDATTLRIADNLKRAKLAVILLTHDLALAGHYNRRFALRDGRLAEFTANE